MIEFKMIGRMCLFLVTLLHESSSFHSSNIANNGRNRCFDLKSKASSSSFDGTSNRTVTILERGPNHIVALKPPSVVCHHSGWTGSRSKAKRGEEPEIPMLQRVRDAIHDIDSRNARQDDEEKIIRRVNLVHRLDRGASGALLFAFADCDDDDDDEKEDATSTKGTTANLIEAMASDESTKTYVALVRGEGIFRGEDLKERGWFEVTRPIKDESGEEKDATTMFKFVAGQPETDEDGIHRPRISLVLARPKQGRWHQIRKHLRSLSHPILGDTTHGASTVNREWKEKRNLPGERICLHMARMQLPPTDAVPQGIDVAAPLLDDMLNMLKVYAPDVLEEARPILINEGIIVEATQEYEIGEYTIPEELLRSKNDEGDDVEILAQGKYYVVANKPPSVVVHHSSWTGKKSDPNRRWKEATPMLQRVRDKTGKKVNPVHRLDRGKCMNFILKRW
jgi:tRNA pseudouridine65 synthase